MGKTKKRQKSESKSSDAAAASRGVVGPEYFQVLTGKLASKSVTLVLCGETHEDAIDVTRASGRFCGKEGWIQHTDAASLATEILVGMVGRAGAAAATTTVKHRICKRKDKLLPLSKAKEWANGIVANEIDYLDSGSEIVLLWAKDSVVANKGRTCVVELFAEDNDEGIHDDSKSQEDSNPDDIGTILDAIGKACGEFGSTTCRVAADEKKGSNKSTGDSIIMLFVWGDLDSEARAFNYRRLQDEDIATNEHDTLIRERKKKRREEENIWAWDDWLGDAKSNLQGDDTTALHVVLEAPVPPWEVELCRDLDSEFELSPAAECIRCLSEDSAESELDECDPSSDGFGSYADYIYRQLLEDQSHDWQSSFLHCVDCRDLGCEHACVAETLHKDWMDLLQQEEENFLCSGRDHAHHKDGRVLFDWEHNPEEVKLVELQESGVLVGDGSIESDDESDNDFSLITFPSFEGFFGQNTDIMYYSPNVKIAYGPFLGQCVTSYDKWKQFFTKLFLGGSVADALSVLDLSESKRPYMHVRSPIMKSWDPSTGEYQWYKRNNEEHDLTFPVLPVRCFLKAKGSNPASTWSSAIFANLVRNDRQELRDLAQAVQEWVLHDIERHCEHPKHPDDGGGEWFMAYLRQVHRAVYNDIDHTDPEALLRKNYATSISFGSLKKYRIGEISVPSCQDGFQRILRDLPGLQQNTGSPAMGPEAEVMARILIDIYMSKLVDFSAILKIAQVASKESHKNIAIVCYMGSAHTRAVGEFFCTKLSFKKKIFAGKLDWDEQEARVIYLPTELWNLSLLFK